MIGTFMQVNCPKEYDDWLQSMYVLFGSKFSKIFCGPMWSVISTSQGAGNLATDQDPLMVK